MIKVTGLTKRYQKINAVNQVDFSVGKGEFLALIGPNGAGKTTLFKMLLGLVRPTEGSVFVCDQDVTDGWPKTMRDRLGYVPENVQHHPNFTGREVLSFFAKLKKAPRDQCDQLLKDFDLQKAADRRVGEYSKGMKQRLGIAQALLAQPQILFLDEPTTGLDPQGVQIFYQVMDSLRLKGVTIVMTSHVLSEIENRVDRLGIMDHGKLVRMASQQKLVESLDLKRRFHIVYKGKGDSLELLAKKHGAEIKFHDQSEEQGEVEVYCPSNFALSFMKGVFESSLELVDFQTRQPSLEELFEKLTGDRL